MEMLPLGSIINANGHDVCVIGYGSDEKDSVSVLGYLVVPYPLGFIEMDKVFFIPLNGKFELVAEGYHTEATTKLLETVSKSFEAIKGASDEELEQFNLRLREAKKGGASE